jgi:hypothetical protein
MQITSIFHRLTFANVTSSLALFIALGGASYAAIKVPANSVGTKQVKNRAITQRKLDPRVLTSLHGARGLPGSPGVQGPQGLQGLQGPKGDAGPAGAGALADGAVTTSKLADSSVTQSKVGLTTALATSSVDSNANKAELATCPAGTSVIGGAVEVVDQSHHALNGVAAISYSGPVTFSGQYWEGAAYRTAGSASYGLDVIAFCTKS